MMKRIFIFCFIPFAYSCSTEVINQPYYTCDPYNLRLHTDTIDNYIVQYMLPLHYTKSDNKCEIEYIDSLCPASSFRINAIHEEFPSAMYDDYKSEGALHIQRELKESLRPKFWSPLEKGFFFERRNDTTLLWFNIEGSNYIHSSETYGYISRNNKLLWVHIKLTNEDVTSHFPLMSQIIESINAYPIVEVDQLPVFYNEADTSLYRLSNRQIALGELLVSVDLPIEFQDYSHTTKGITDSTSYFIFEIRTDSLVHGPFSVWRSQLLDSCKRSLIEPYKMNYLFSSMQTNGTDTIIYVSDLRTSRMVYFSFHEDIKDPYEELSKENPYLCQTVFSEIKFVTRYGNKNIYATVKRKQLTDRYLNYFEQMKILESIRIKNI